VQTESGAVVGKIETLPHGKSVHEYLGIPYAEPPVGELRFAAPKPAKPWSGIKDSTAFGASCTMMPLSTGMAESTGNSEDCLFLNVFVPSTIKPDEKMTVMVWIHGGAFSLGSSTGYYGGVLAAFNDVIVVSFNYRLGVFGFFNVPGTEVKGNYGILDQVLALKWVQANIANFGGDPNRVTIFGQSAGGMSVSLHLISPLSRGLFQRAIMQSGASSTPMFSGKVNKPRQLEWFAKAINCSLGPTLVECARAKTSEDILNGQIAIMLGGYTGSLDIVGPIVDGECLPDLPENLFKTGKFPADVDVIIGVTSHEGALLALIRPPDQFAEGVEQEVFESIVRREMLYARELNNRMLEDVVLFEYTNHPDPDNKNTTRHLLLEIFGDSAFVAPAMLEAKALAKGGRPPYFYVFNHRPVLSPLPAWISVAHGTDIAFVLGAPFKSLTEPYVNIITTKYSEIEKGLSLYVMKLWSDFAKYGSPNPPDASPAQVTWPTFTEQEQAYLVLDMKPRVQRKYKADKEAFWNEIIPKLIEFNKNEKEKAEEKAPKDEL